MSKGLEIGQTGKCGDVMHTELFDANRDKAVTSDDL